MESNKKEWLIIGAIALIIVLTYIILMSFQVTYWKHQNIAYEQYKAEDLRQARIYNSTFASSNEEFIKKIENYPEQDKTIAKALYEVKPEIDTMKKQLKENKSKSEKLTEEISHRHNILADTVETVKYMTIKSYLIQYNINYKISKEEYLHLLDLFVPKSYVTSADKKAHEDFATAGIEYYEDNEVSNYRSYKQIEEELTVANSNVINIEQKLNEYKSKYSDLIKENSPTLEYQDTIITNGIKTASDYLFTI